MIRQHMSAAIYGQVAQQRDIAEEQLEKKKRTLEVEEFKSKTDTVFSEEERIKQRLLYT